MSEYSVPTDQATYEDWDGEQCPSPLCTCASCTHEYADIPRFKTMPSRELLDALTAKGAK